MTKLELKEQIEYFENLHRIVAGADTSSSTLKPKKLDADGNNIYEDVTFSENSVWFILE